MKKSSLNPAKPRTSISNNIKTPPLNTLVSQPRRHCSVSYHQSAKAKTLQSKQNYLSASFPATALDQTLSHGYTLAKRNFSSTNNPFAMQNTNTASRESLMNCTSGANYCEDDHIYYNEQHSCSESVTHSTHLQKHRDVWCVALAPIHLNGLDSIAKTFGKSRQTIKKWCKQGAPIAFDGFSYCSEYMTLFIWFLNNNPATCDEQSI